MRNTRETGPGSRSQTWPTLAGLPMTVFFFLISLVTCPSASPKSLKAKLDAAPFKIAYESYVSNNWEIFVCDANGSLRRKSRSTTRVWFRSSPLGSPATERTLTNGSAQGSSARLDSFPGWDISRTHTSISAASQDGLWRRKQACRRVIQICIKILFQGSRSRCQKPPRKIPCGDPRAQGTSHGTLAPRERHNLNGFPSRLHCSGLLFNPRWTNSNVGATQSLSSWGRSTST